MEFRRFIYVKEEMDTPCSELSFDNAIYQHLVKTTGVGEKGLLNPILAVLKAVLKSSVLIDK